MGLWLGWEVGCGEVSLAHLRAMGTVSDLSRVSGKASAPPELWEKPWPAAAFLTATSQPLVPPV